MSSTTYPVETPRWLWDLFKRAIDDSTDYDKYNDRLVEAIAVDVQRFEDAGLLELDEFDERRINRFLDEVRTDDGRVPGHTDGFSPTGGSAGASSTSDPGGERTR